MESNARNEVSMIKVLNSYLDKNIEQPKKEKDNRGYARKKRKIFCAHERF